MPPAVPAVRSLTVLDMVVRSRDKVDDSESKWHIVLSRVTASRSADPRPIGLYSHFSVPRFCLVYTAATYCGSIRLYRYYVELWDSERGQKMHEKNNFRSIFLVIYGS
jgi:hypothetical protein